MADSIVMSIDHIVKTPGVLGGRPRIAGRRIAVDRIAHDHLTLGMSLAEIGDAYDLQPAQIHAALAYYFDHRKEIDLLIAAEAAAFDRLPDDPSQARLRETWHSQHPSDFTDANLEMTISEIAETFGVNARGVREAASKGWIPARKSGATWLIRRRDAHQRWGDKRR